MKNRVPHQSHSQQAVNVNNRVLTFFLVFFRLPKWVSVHSQESDKPTSDSNNNRNGIYAYQLSRNSRDTGGNKITMKSCSICYLSWT